MDQKENFFLKLQKEYLENELQRLTEALISMEQEFITKEDEKTTLISDYEQMIWWYWRESGWGACNGLELGKFLEFMYWDLVRDLILRLRRDL